ncbi:flavo protein [Hanseniaspora valbyensis NRRL Y-1626]|uniref:Flavo protein n=1 Tax=Hanseniaspora valbyensis NRRL Y-1626 TaxID=766949 RepID=A0A1B7TG93_9ASCO|nr:flavo protein [Hanseniaspora valbyensis NRRL Y-1626]
MSNTYELEKKTVSENVEPVSEIKKTFNPPRPLLNKVGSSGHNIYSSNVRKTSEKSLYGDKLISKNSGQKNSPTPEKLKVISQPSEVYISKPNSFSTGPSIVSRSNSLKQPQTGDGNLKKDTLLKQASTTSFVSSSTPMNQKPPTSILNHGSTPVRSRGNTFANNNGEGGDVSFIDDSGLKTPVSAIQFQFEDKIPLRRLPHQHRGSMTPRVGNVNSANDFSNEISNDGNIGIQMMRSRTNSHSKRSFSTPGSNNGKQSGSSSSSTATSAIMSGNNNNSFLSVSINDIVAQLTGKVNNTQPIRKEAVVTIPGGFGDDEDGYELQSQIETPIEKPKTGNDILNGKKPSPQLIPINNLINRSANSSTTSLKEDMDVECKPTKQRIFEYLPKEDDGKYHILLGATGSVASIKIPLIVNKLLKYYTPEQCSIQVVLTKSSLKFIKGLKISPLVKIWTDDDLSYLTNQPYKLGDPILQIELRRWADIFVVAPLSANTLAKISNGISDNLLTNIIRGWPASSTPLYLAPAMNTFMYIHPLTKIHLTTIQELYANVEILKPVEKVLVCGDIGMGGMREWSDICALVINKLDKMNKDELENTSEEEDEDDDEDEYDDEEECDSLVNRNETDDEDHSEDIDNTDDGMDE